MAIARRLSWYLRQRALRYEVVPHARSASSRETMEVAHVAGDQLAKAVLLEDVRGYVLAVLPSSRMLDLRALRDSTARRFEFASEAELVNIFDDCELGAVPPTGFAYGIPTWVDDSLLHLPSVHFEAGDHRDLVRMQGSDFARLMQGARVMELGQTSISDPAAIRVRARDERDWRLDEERVHVLSLRSYGAGLRAQQEYEKDGHTGMILMKTPELRVLLEAVRANTTLASHVVHGPTTLYVIEGALDVRTDGATHRVGEFEMASLPRDEQREIRACADSLFTLAVSPMSFAANPRETRTTPTPATGVRRILIVANRTVGGPHLLDAVRSRIAEGPCKFVVLCPAAPSHAHATWEERAARTEANDRLLEACTSLRAVGARVEGVVGDFYPIRAVRDVLLVESFDEILVSTLPAGVSEWLRMDLPSRIARHFDGPVTHVPASSDVPG